MSPRDVTEFEDLTEEAISIDCAGGVLAGVLYRPTGPIRAAVLISAATAVRQDYYAAFARWLARTERVAVLTYDYSDFGASATGPLRDATATMATWAIRDLSAARAHLAALFPDDPLWLIGHSLGAMVLHLHREFDRVERIISVASGPAYWQDHPMPFRMQAWLFWHGPVPLITRLLGYLPGRSLGFGADLPSGVYWQWRRWCTSRAVFNRDVGKELPHPSKTPICTRIKFVAIADDVMIPPHSVWKLIEHYPEAQKRQCVINPEAFGLKAIGHIGPFATRNAAIWPEIVRDFQPAYPAH